MSATRRAVIAVTLASVAAFVACDDGPTGPPPPTPEIRTVALAPALAGYPYNVRLEAERLEGAQITWSVVEGSLPNGLSLSSTGRFSGSPTRADSAVIVIEASAGGPSDRQEFSLVVHEEDTTRFNITVLAAVPIPSELRDNVAEAVRRWEEAIVGNLTRWDVPEGSLDIRDPEEEDDVCSEYTHLADGTSIDDLTVIVNIGPIDEAGSWKPIAGGDSLFTNTIGSAGPCFIRIAGGDAIEGDSLPMVGVLTLDEHDLFGLEQRSQELATDLLQHEIGHILGLGTMWRFRGLLEGSGTNDPRYTGERGVAAYQAAGGEDEAIPVENLGPDGSLEGHWRESEFGRDTAASPPRLRDELMIAELRHNSYLSAMSIASFADFGYEVDTSAAEDELVLSRMGMIESAAFKLRLDHDIDRGRVIGIEPDGRQRNVAPLHPNDEM